MRYHVTTDSYQRLDEIDALMNARLVDAPIRCTSDENFLKFFCAPNQTSSDRIDDGLSNARNAKNQLDATATNSDTHAHLNGARQVTLQVHFLAAPRDWCDMQSVRRQLIAAAINSNKRENISSTQRRRIATCKFQLPRADSRQTRKRE